MDRPHVTCVFHSSTTRCWGLTVVSDPAMDFSFFGMSSYNLLSFGYILKGGLVAGLVSFLSTCQSWDHLGRGNVG